MIKTFFSIILAGLIFLSAIALTLFQLESPKMLIGQAQKVDLYGKLSARLADVDTSALVKQSNFSNKDMAEIITYAIDGKTFYEMLETSSTAYINYVTGKSKDFKLTLDLKGVKSRAQEKLIGRASSNYDNYPLCKGKEISGWNVNSKCKLPNNSLSDSDLSRLSRSQSQVILDQIPDTLNYDQPSKSLESTRNTVSRVNKGVYLLWFITIFLILLFFMISRVGAFWPLSISCILAGLLLLGFSMIGWDYLVRTLTEFLSASTKANPWTELGIAFGTQLIGTLKTFMGNLSIGILGTGGACIILAVAMRFKKSGA